MQLAYQTAGDPSQPAIMLLHGFMSCNAQWLLNTQALAASHFLVMVELWGHGESPTPDTESDYTIDAYLKQFEAIRTAHDIERWHLVGQSYGAGLVLHYAAEFPQRCNAVVVTNSRSAFAADFRKRSNVQSRTERRLAAAQPFQPRKLPYHPIHAKRFPNEVKEALVARADAMSEQAIKLGGELGASLNCVELMGRLTTPVLLVNGRYERSFQADLKNLVARHPELQVVDLAGGHSVNVEAADGFNKATLAFFGKHAQAGQ